jgi:hypothetical protein
MSLFDTQKISSPFDFFFFLFLVSHILSFIFLVCLEAHKEGSRAAKGESMEWSVKEHQMLFFLFFF